MLAPISAGQVRQIVFAGQATHPLKCITRIAAASPSHTTHAVALSAHVLIPFIRVHPSVFICGCFLSAVSIQLYRLSMLGLSPTMPAATVRMAATNAASPSLLAT